MLALFAKTIFQNQHICSGENFMSRFAVQTLPSLFLADFFSLLLYLSIIFKLGDKFKFTFYQRFQKKISKTFSLHLKTNIFNTIYIFYFSNLNMKSWRKNVLCKTKSGFLPTLYITSHCKRDYVQTRFCNALNLLVYNMWCIKKHLCTS